MASTIASYLSNFFSSLKYTLDCPKLSLSKRKNNMAQVSTPPVEGLGVPRSTSEAVTIHSPPKTQSLLLLHEKGQPYQVHEGGELPELAFGDLLVEIHAIGLNPIDWKSA